MQSSGATTAHEKKPRKGDEPLTERCTFMLSTSQREELYQVAGYWNVGAVVRGAVLAYIEDQKKERTVGS